MISRRIKWVICIFLAVVIATGYSFPVSTTGSDPELTVSALGISNLEIPEAAAFLAVRQAALTFIQATHDWADAVRPRLLGGPSAVNGAPAPADSGTLQGHNHSAAPGVPTSNRTDSTGATAVYGLRKLSAKEKGQKLIEAAKEGKVKELKALLADGADAGARESEEDGWSALDWAAAEGHVKSARLLLAAGADVGATTRGQWTPLHRAAFWGHTDVVRLLLENGADHSARDDDGWTPLHSAAYNGHEKAAAALIEAGADRAATTNKDNTPLDLARQSHQRLVQLLSGTRQQSTESQNESSD